MVEIRDRLLSIPAHRYNGVSPHELYKKRKEANKGNPRLSMYEALVLRFASAGSKPRAKDFEGLRDLYVDLDLGDAEAFDRGVDKAKAEGKKLKKARAIEDRDEDTKPSAAEFSETFYDEYDVCSAVFGEHDDGELAIWHDEKWSRSEKVHWGVAGNGWKEYYGAPASAGNMKGVIDIVDIRARIDSPVEMDTKKHLLGCPDSYVVDLRTGELRKQKPEDYISLSVSVVPEEGPTTMWDETLDFFTMNDSETVDYLKRYYGYLLTGEIGAAEAVYMYGGGGNGKSTQIKILKSLMGNYARPLSESFFDANPSNRDSFEVAAFRGKRLLYNSECGCKRQWDETRFKGPVTGELGANRQAYE